MNETYDTITDISQIEHADFYSSIEQEMRCEILAKSFSLFEYRGNIFGGPLSDVLHSVGVRPLAQEQVESYKQYKTATRDDGSFGWRRFLHGGWYKHSERLYERYSRFVPLYALDIANSIKEACWGPRIDVDFFIDELTFYPAVHRPKAVDILKMRWMTSSRGLVIPDPDPFLLVTAGWETYYLAAWDERDWETAGIRSFEEGK